MGDMSQCSGVERPVIGALLWIARLYEKLGNKQKTEYCRSILKTQGSLGQTVSENAQSIHWLDVDGFFLRRLLWQDSLGPSKCVKMVDRAPSSTQDYVAH